MLNETYSEKLISFIQRDDENGSKSSDKNRPYQDEEEEEEEEYKKNIKKINKGFFLFDRGNLTLSKCFLHSLQNIFHSKHRQIQSPHGRTKMYVHNLLPLTI